MQQLAGMTPQGRQQAIATYEFAHKQWAQKNANDPGADDYVRRVDSSGVGSENDPEPQPPKLSAIRTAAGEKKALEAYKLAHQQWEQRQKNAVPAHASASDRKSAKADVEDAFDDWVAGRTQLGSDGKPSTGSEMFDDQQKKTRINIGSHVFLTNGSMSPVDALDAAHSLLTVNGDDPSKLPWTKAQATPNGSISFTLMDGRSVTLDKDGVASLVKERERLTQSARADSDKRAKAIADQKSWDSGGGYSGRIKRGLEQFVGPTPRGSPQTAIDVSPADTAPNF
jgi:hypothetical protein